MNENGSNLPEEKSSDAQQLGGWMSLGSNFYIKTAIIAVLFCLFFYSDLYQIIYRWFKDPSWSHGLLIPFFSLYFLNQHTEDITRLESRPNYLGLVLLIGCLVLYFLNIAHFSFGYASPILMIASLGMIVLFLGGWKLVKYAWLPVTYLIFAVPLPGRFEKAMTIPMRKLAASIASGVLNFVPELETNANGAVVDVVYKGVQMGEGLDVADACSGMRLLTAFLALGVAMAYLHYRPAWQRLVLLACTVPIAIACNVIRVTTTCFIYILWNPEYAKGIYHDLLGMLMLPLAFGMYGLIAWFMSNLFEDEDAEEVVEEVIIRRKQP